jgi:hypothetical protein
MKGDVHILDKNIKKSIWKVAAYYDGKKVDDTGPLGFRRTSDLSRLSACLDELIMRDILVPGESLFLDMGCGDGRVNVLFSYFVKMSVGIEQDEWTLEEYIPLKKELESELKRDNQLFPPDNIFLFHGDSMNGEIHESICLKTGAGFSDFDVYYTYLTMYEEFADLIIRKGKKGAIFMIYGLDSIMPGLDGYELLTGDMPMQGILAVYRKIS